MMRAALMQAPALAVVAMPMPLRDGAILVSDLIDLYFQGYTGRDTTRVHRLGWWKQQLGALRVDQVTDDHIHAALDRLAEARSKFYAGKDADGVKIMRARSKPIAPATVNRYSAAAAALFTWAQRKRIAPHGWVHPCRTVERKRETGGRTRYLTDDERRRLLDACKASRWPRLYLLTLLALTTGARRGALLGLRWSNVDLERCIVTVERTKNNDPIALPLVPAAVEELKRFVGPSGALLFASPTAPDSPFDFRCVWQEALKAARIRGFVWHDLRHSCASYLAQSGATLVEIAQVLGHRQLQMSLRYAHLSVNHKAALVNRVLGDIR